MREFLTAHLRGYKGLEIHLGCHTHAIPTLLQLLLSSVYSQMHFFILYLLSLILELWFISHLLRSLHSILVTSIFLKLDDGFWQSSPIFTFLSATTLNLGADVSKEQEMNLSPQIFSSSFVNWKFRLFYNLLVLHFSISLLSSKCKTKVVFFLLLLYCNCVFYRINGFFSASCNNTAGLVRNREMVISMKICFSSTGAWK